MNSDHRGNDDIGVSCGTINARAESTPLLARRSHQSCGGLAQSACLVLHHQVRYLQKSILSRPLFLTSLGQQKGGSFFVLYTNLTLLYNLLLQQFQLITALVRPSCPSGYKLCQPKTELGFVTLQCFCELCFDLWTDPVLQHSLVLQMCLKGIVS